MEIEIYIATEAAQLVDDVRFRQKWSDLHERCPWATVFQAENFVAAWYSVYKERWSPLLIVATDGSGRLIGLLTLAISMDNGAIVAAGGHQAEYQAWLSDPQHGDDFIVGALGAIRERFPAKVLQFLFVPPGTPLEWAKAGQYFGNAIVRDIRRPLMSVGDGSSFRETLKKKRYKSRLGWLERKGKVRFEHITSPVRLEEIFDEVVTLGAFRIGAVHNTLIEEDPLKKPFYFEMMSKGGLLHATALWAGEQLISAHIGVHNKKQLILGILNYSPFFAKYSPGKLHLLMLGAELAKEQIDSVDLTPGAGYKDGFATHYDDSYILTIFFNRLDFLKHRVKRNLIAGAKSALQKVNVTPSRAQDITGYARHKLVHTQITTLPGKLYKATKHRLWSTSEMRLYEFDVATAQSLQPSEIMNKDHLPDLLAYRPSEAWQPRVSPFLRQAMESLELGHHVYTFVQDGALIHCGWLIERQEKSILSDVGYELNLPPESAVLTSYYTHPAARGRGLYRQSLTQMLHDASLIPETKHIYIAVLANNGPSRHVIEKLGFEYRFSFFKKTTGNKVLRWTNAPATFAKLLVPPS